MYLKAQEDSVLVDKTLEKKVLYFAVLFFNFLMYLTMFILIVAYYLDIGHSNYDLAFRLFRAILELLVTVGFFISGFHLARMIKKIYQRVPNSIIFWMCVACIASTYRCFEQLLFYLFENEYSDQFYIFILISYNIDDLLPTLVYLHSFSQFKKFMKESSSSECSFSDILLDY